MLFSLNMYVKETGFSYIAPCLTYFGHYNDIPEEPRVQLERGLWIWTLRGPIEKGITDQT